MADTITLPGTGPVKKKYVAIGGVALAATLGYAYYRNKSAAAAAAVTSPADSTDGSDPSIDPATGVPYADETGMLGSGGADGGVSSYGGSYYGSGQITGYDQYGNPIYSTGITGNNQFTTNSGWATQAENDLQAAGYDFTTASQAISRVLAGLTVTSAQEQIFMQAVGLDSQPPQGYPQPIKVVDSPAQPGGTGTGGTTGGGSTPEGPITGLSARGGHTTAAFSWHAVAGAQGYAYTITDLQNGGKKSGTTKATSIQIGGLAKGHEFNFGIQALPGGPGDNIHVKTG